MSMISEQMTRKQLGEQQGLKGAELTAWIKERTTNKQVVSMMRYIDPSRSEKRERVYCFVAQQTSMPV